MQRLKYIFAPMVSYMIHEGVNMLFDKDFDFLTFIYYNHN